MLAARIMAFRCTYARGVTAKGHGTGSSRANYLASTNGRPLQYLPTVIRSDIIPVLSK
jgi:hypothetical protein